MTVTVPLVPKVQRNQRERLTGPPAPKVVPPLAAGCVEGLCRKAIKMDAAFQS